MTKVVGVQFRKSGKIYYFSPDELEIKVDDNVIVETARGVEFGKIVIVDKEINEEELATPLKSVMRIATPEDVAHDAENQEKEKDAYKICEKKILESNLEMKLIDTEYTFDNNKLLFYFTAEGRIDFRELVKELASIFRTRIELRQIGVRDETKMMNGIGMCGRPYCCANHLTEFVPVSIKMAKEQGLSLNPTKISGCCGRLMCCLKYEQDVYEDKLNRVPRVGAIVETADGKGTVIDIEILKETAKVKLDGDSDAETIKQYPVSDIKIIKNGGKASPKPISDGEEASMEELKQLED